MESKIKLTTEELSELHWGVSCAIAASRETITLDVRSALALCDMAEELKHVASSKDLLEVDLATEREHNARVTEAAAKACDRADMMFSHLEQIYDLSGKLLQQLSLAELIKIGARTGHEISHIVNMIQNLADFDHEDDARRIIERCIDTKGQKSVSLSRLAEVLGVDDLSEEEKKSLVESRKFPQFHEQNFKTPYILPSAGQAFLMARMGMTNNGNS